MVTRPVRRRAGCALHLGALPHDFGCVDGRCHVFWVSLCLRRCERDWRDWEIVAFLALVIKHEWMANTISTDRVWV